ncbi:hypothetical protein ACWCOZ_20255 [Streptomyces sp. NPDC001840]
MPYRAPLTNHHADDSICPPEHKHTVTGKPRHPECPGRFYSQAVCSCGTWEIKHPGKGYVNECRRRHLDTHQKQEDGPGPEVLRNLLRLDPQ